MLAVRVVARGDGGFSPTSTPTDTAHHRGLPLGRGIREVRAAKKVLQTTSKGQNTPLLHSGRQDWGGLVFFFDE